MVDFYKNKKILITGHTGFKGSWLSLLLNKLGAEVYGYALEPPTRPSLYQEAILRGLISSHIADVRDLEELKKYVKKIQPQIVFHLAAQPLVRDSYKSPVLTFETNVMGTVNLLESCRNVDSIKAIVNITTDKCYENNEWVWGYRETDRLGGFDPYSNSKACSELITASYRDSFFNAKLYSKHGVAVASARAGNVIGGGDWAKDRLIPDFIRSIIDNKKLVIRNPLATRPWQHVLEPLTGYLTLAKNLFENGVDYSGAWNFGPADSDVISVETVMKSICELWGSEATYEIKPVTLHESNNLKLDCSKANSLLAWFPKWNAQKAISSIVEWNKLRLSGADVRIITEQQINEYLEK